MRQFYSFVIKLPGMLHSLIIEPTNYTPRVSFEPSGILSLKGRSLMIDAVNFYAPLIAWLSELNAERVQFTIELDYFNTSSSKKLLEMLKIPDSNNNVTDFVVYWGFETDDEDILIKGQILKERLKKASFRFNELASV